MKVWVPAVQYLSHWYICEVLKGSLRLVAAPLEERDHFAKIIGVGYPNLSVKVKNMVPYLDYLLTMVLAPKRTRMPSYKSQAPFTGCQLGWWRLWLWVPELNCSRTLPVQKEAGVSYVLRPRRNSGLQGQSQVLQTLHLN